jgi:hypothetical protein
MNPRESLQRFVAARAEQRVSRFLGLRDCEALPNEDKENRRMNFLSGFLISPRAESIAPQLP